MSNTERSERQRFAAELRMTPGPRSKPAERRDHPPPLNGHDVGGYVDDTAERTGSPNQD